VGRGERVIDHELTLDDEIVCSSCGDRVKVSAGRGGDSTWGLTEPVGNTTTTTTITTTTTTTTTTNNNNNNNNNNNTKHFLHAK